MKARRGVLGTLVMAGGDLCAMTRSSTLCGRSTLLGKSGLSALGRAAATLLTQEGHAQDMSFEIAANTAWPTRGSYTRRGSRARGYAGPIGHTSRPGGAVAAGPPGTLVYSTVAIPGTQNPRFSTGSGAFHSFSQTPPNRYAEQALKNNKNYEIGSAEMLWEVCPRGQNRCRSAPLPSPAFPRRPSLTRDSERIALSATVKHGQAQQEHQAQVHPPERHAPRDRRGREGQVPLARGARELLPSARP